MEEPANQNSNEAKNEGVPFNAQEVFGRTDNFNCNMMGYPSNETRQEWFSNNDAFKSELEDLMRKYKVVQVVASIFSKL